MALGLALGALGLERLPVVAWVLAVALNVLAVVALLRVVGPIAARRAPFAAACAAAFVTGLATLAPTLAVASPAVSAGILAAIGVVTFLAGFVLWLDVFEPRSA